MGQAPEFFELLTQEERDGLDRIGHLVRAGRGEVLLARGDAADRILVLREGRAKVAVANSVGADTVLAFRGRGALLGEQALIDAKGRSASVVAAESVELLVIAASVFRGHLTRNPRLMFAMLAVLSGRLRDADRRLTEFAGADALTRVCARLVELCDAWGRAPADDAADINVPITQDELAGWAGASLESTAKSLRALRALGWVSTGRGVIAIKDLEALRTRSC